MGFIIFGHEQTVYTLWGSVVIEASLFCSLYFDSGTQALGVEETE